MATKILSSSGRRLGLLIDNRLQPHGMGRLKLHQRSESAWPLQRTTKGALGLLPPSVTVTSIGGPLPQASYCPPPPIQLATNRESRGAGLLTTSEEPCRLLSSHLFLLLGITHHSMHIEIMGSRLPSPPGMVARTSWIYQRTVARGIYPYRDLSHQHHREAKMFGIHQAWSPDQLSVYQSFLTVWGHLLMTMGHTHILHQPHGAVAGPSRRTCPTNIVSPDIRSMGG